MLSPKNVQSMRALFNIAHRLSNVLGPAWALVLETMNTLDTILHSPHTTTQASGKAVPGAPLLLRSCPRESAGAGAGPGAGTLWWRGACCYERSGAGECAHPGMAQRGHGNGNFSAT